MKKRSTAFGAAMCVLVQCLIAAGTLCCAAPEADGVRLGVSAKSYCVINADTGEVVLEYNSGIQLHPASITKILTLLTAVENCEELDTLTTVSERAINDIAPLSSTLAPMPKPGEQFTILDLLYGLTMRSGNECANIIAEAISGNIDSFVELMNECARELGTVNTHFSNPHGLDEDDHLTTAYDMAIIMKAALKNPTVKEILSAKTYTIPATAYADERVMCSGHKMVSGEYECEGVYAGKSGYTRLAQSTLVTAAKRDGINLIAVVMGSDSGVSYDDTKLLLDNAYAKINDWGLSGGFNVYHPRVSDMDDTGFTVTWEVGPEAVRAEFPVWIEYDDTDVLTRDEAMITSDTVSCRVELSSHAGRAGVYTVQAYVYNSSGSSNVCTIKVLGGAGILKPGFISWNGNTYYMHENGALGLQWQELAEGVYYFDYITAQMQTGWIGEDTRFYLDKDGKMHTGWLTLGTDTYYFFKAGDMVTGDMLINGQEYSFDDDGVLLEGFVLPQIPGASG